MPYSTLNWSIADRVLTLTLNRPDQLNAFTVEMANELVHAFGRASEDDAVGAVVVTGAGRAFCAGMDLSRPGNVFGLDETLTPTLRDMNERLHDPVIESGLRDTGGRVTLAIFDCKKPVIAAINGPAVGIGATMTLAMDVRLASDKARIGFVFGKIGIVPEACSSWFLPRIVGIAQALEWTYSADIIDAEEARRGGPAQGRIRAGAAAAGGLQAGPPHHRPPLPRRHRPDPPDDVPQRRPAAPAGSAQGGLAGRVLHQPPGRQGGREVLPGKARAGL
jgi:enoyl-CoA hydratase/carnithine racemase